VGIFDITLTENCTPGLVPNQTSGLPSGSTFPSGETIMTYLATDASGNTATCSFSVTVPSDMSVTTDSENVSCFGEDDGSISTAVTGGAPGYSYEWNNGAMTSSISALGAGSYSVTVTDSDGCEEVETVTITEPSLIITSLVSVTNETGSQSNGAIDVAVNGGEPPYSYVWTNPNGEVISNQQDVSGLPAGTYQLEVTDANGCVSLSAYTIQSVNSTDEDELLSHISLFPNPSSGWVTLELTGVPASEIEVNAFDVIGRETVKYSSEGTVNGKHQLDFSHQPSGVYLLKIQIDGMVVTKRLVVSR
jgi:hypothetical protein